MIVISNNLLGKIPLLDSTTIRINLAWVKKEDVSKLLDESTKDIYLDYPDGRKKPPVPTMTIEEAIEFSKHPKVKYFAFSNATIDRVLEIKDKIDCQLVPKIETEQGVRDIPEMIKAGIKMFMLDKEDLYTDVNCNPDEFNRLVNDVRSFRSEDIIILELQGVVFI